MKRLLVTLAGISVIAPASHAQLISGESSTEEAWSLDQDYTYDSNSNKTYYLYQKVDQIGVVGDALSDYSNPYSIEMLNQTVSGTGDGAAILTSESSTDNSYSISEFLSTNGNMTSEVTNSGSAYGAYGVSQGYCYLSVEFTVSEDCSLSWLWQMSSNNSSGGSCDGVLYDYTNNTQHPLFDVHSGAQSGNDSLSLSAGDYCELLIQAVATSTYNYNGSTGYSTSGYYAANGYFTANITPAPEPATLSLLGLAAVGVLRRRRLR